MMATIPGSAASMCILFNASDAGGFSYRKQNSNWSMKQFRNGYLDFRSTDAFSSK